MPAVDAAKENEIWKAINLKESDNWAKSFDSGPTPNLLASHNQPENKYRIPTRGQSVIIAHMSNRKELNGMRGEIIDPTLDGHGRLTVHVFDNDISGTSGRRMKILPGRLAPGPAGPGRSASTPLLRSSAASDVESALSCSVAGSRAGSMASRSSRRLGSAISATAANAISGSRFE
eukprot:gnl/TRDRNA2_/TRDRNA2_187589_c0_seq1.p1 gnl/TRDRNA2_/TRDRNA2_187589_c0~~gnl/TRDRNA2_/TRDRNA2_187589_c0_seq1.p1  ORF type:complete len:176 (+),score=16.80 gnl/TRDRNA2_/TRDRNA2_187589_c0_seq1:51-578(+)